jgi:hypothetical protein
MKLEYTILWIDNDKETIKMKAPQIGAYLDSQWFTLRVLPSNYSELDAILKKKDTTPLIDYMTTSCKREDINLILIDYNLAEDKKGDVIIKGLRDNNIFTDIVFYSAGAFVNKTSAHLEGIFYASTGVITNNFLEKTKSVIDVTLKKNQDINNIRGLFIAETIDLTRHMEELISKILCLTGDSLSFFTDQIIQEEFFNDFAKYRIIKRFLDRKIEKLVDEIESAEGTEIGKLLETSEKIVTISEEFSHFQKDIIELRNELAHAKKSDKDRHSLIIRNKEKGCFEVKDFGENKCAETRQKFIMHGKKLAEIEAFIGGLKAS